MTAARFTTNEVCAVAMINKKQLEHAIDPKRSILNLSVHGTSRVQGKRRIFTCEDAIKITTLFVLMKIGFPRRHAKWLCEAVARRAENLLAGIDKNADFSFVSYPLPNGVWVYFTTMKGQKKPRFPICVHLFAVDRFLEETFAKLQAIEHGEVVY